MYLEYVIETTVMYTWQGSLIIACLVYIVDTVRKWTRRSK